MSQSDHIKLNSPYARKPIKPVTSDDVRGRSSFSTVSENKWHKILSKSFDKNQ